MAEAPANPRIPLVSGTHYSNISFDTAAITAAFNCPQGYTLDRVEAYRLRREGRSTWHVGPPRADDGVELLDGLVLGGGKIYGTPVSTGIYLVNLRARCSNVLGSVQIVETEVDLVVTGRDYMAGDEHLRHAHAGQANLVAVLMNVLNSHHHMHADTEETKALARHTNRLNRLAARVSALENARGQVVGDGE